MAGFPPHVVDAALSPRPKVSAAQVEADLCGLGVTAAQVADSLFALGCAGDRHCESSCVLADWVLRTYRGVEHVEVTYDEAVVHAYMQILTADGRYFEVETPPAVAEVVIGFGRGRFPELERAAVGVPS